MSSIIGLGLYSNWKDLSLGPTLSIDDKRATMSAMVLGDPGGVVKLLTSSL